MTHDAYTETEPTMVPDLNDEFAHTLSQMARGGEPETVTHLLIADRQPRTKESIAAHLGKKTFEIDGTLAAMEAAGWVIRFPENGLEKFIITSPKPAA